MRYISGAYTQGQLIKDINGIELELKQRFDRDGVITDAVEKRSWRERVQDASFGRNTVMYDDQGNPSVMVVFPFKTIADLVPGDSSLLPHPAFVVNGALKSELFISKYLNFTTGATTTLRGIGLKGKDPGVNIDFDTAQLACKQKGVGWHLLTNAEWAAVALAAKASGFMPRGNNVYGADANVPAEKGTPSYMDGVNPGRTLTGSGPISWAHDGTPFGIMDLNGNVWEWVGGLRLNNGEINILQDNNAADNTKSQILASAEWKGILQAGTIVAPATANTYKINMPTAVAPTLATTIVTSGAGDSAFESMALAGGVTAHSLLKQLGIYPVDANCGGDHFYANNAIEAIALRGGSWNYGASAGVFDLALNAPRASAPLYIGFRSAFVL